MEAQAINELIITQLIISVVGFIIATIGGVLAGFFAGKYKEHKQHKKERDEIDEARIMIEKATARRLIFEAYDDHYIQNKHITVDRKREIKETFEAYRLLGGNGTAKEYYEKLMSIPTHLVTD